MGGGGGLVLLLVLPKGRPRQAFKASVRASNSARLNVRVMTKFFIQSPKKMIKKVACPKICGQATVTSHAYQGKSLIDIPLIILILFFYFCVVGVNNVVIVLWCLCVSLGIGAGFCATGTRLCLLLVELFCQLV